MKKFYSFMTIFCLCFILFMSSCRFGAPQTRSPIAPSIRYYPENYLQMDLPEYRLDLVRFHHTVECEDCYLIGEAILDVLEKDYSSELSQGIITYRTVNSEYLENKPLLLQYSVMEEDFVSHLISPDHNEIKQHHDLWLMVDDDEQLRHELTIIIEQMMTQLKVDLDT